MTQARRDALSLRLEPVRPSDQDAVTDRCCADCTGPEGASKDDRWLANARYARWLAWASLAWMTAEGAIGLAAGFAAGSIALVGWALGSAIEALASVIVAWRFTGRWTLSVTSEHRAQQAVAVSFWLLAPYITIQAIRDLAYHHPSSTSVIGIALTALSVVIMPVLGITKHRLGQRLSSCGHRQRGNPESDVRRTGSCGSGRPGRHCHVARRVADRSRHSAGHRRLVSLGRPPVLAGRSLLLGDLRRNRPSIEHRFEVSVYCSPAPCGGVCTNVGRRGVTSRKRVHALSLAALPLGGAHC